MGDRKSFWVINILYWARDHIVLENCMIHDADDRQDEVSYVGHESLVCRFRPGESLVGAKINDISTEEWSKIIYLDIRLDSVCLHFIGIGWQAVRRPIC